MPFPTIAHQNKCKAKVAKEIAGMQSEIDQLVVSADKNITASAVNIITDSSESREVIAASLDRDLELLKKRSSIVEKADLKKQLLTKYLPLIKEYRESSQKYENLVLVYCTIWAMDVEDIELALDLAKFAVEQQQKLPHYFKS
ncbi:phage terminase small subunit, partial [Microbulbifer sp. OS29]